MADIMVPQTQGRPVLLRQLGLPTALALVVSNMIGTGIFATTGFLAGDLGSAKLILAVWLTGALIALAGALSYSELAINFPSSGGEYVYLTRAFGPEWGFMTGWISFFAGFSVPMALAALTFADYVGHFLPFFSQVNVFVIGTGAFGVRLGWGQALACVLIVEFSILNCMGLRRTAVVQNSFVEGARPSAQRPVAPGQNAYHSALPHRFFQRSASAANLSSMVGCGLGGRAGSLGLGATLCGRFAPGVFIDRAMRLVFASALSTWTFTTWPILTTSLGSFT